MSKFVRTVSLVILFILLAGITWSYLRGGIIWVLFDADLESAQRVTALRVFFDQWGALAPMGYLLFVIIEVIVAPIPGTMLYLPGGVIFGGFLGGTLALLGNVIGAGISCFMMRTIVGQRFTDSFLQKKSLQRLQTLIERHGLGVVLLLRLNPITSSDLVSYAAGLTRMSILSVMLGTLIGMAPLCYAQAYLVEEIFAVFPWLFWPMIFGCVAYAMVVILVVRRLGKSGGLSESPCES